MTNDEIRDRAYNTRKANRTIEELIDFAETYPDLWEILLEENRQTASKLWSLI